MRDEVARLAATKAIEIARSAVKQRGATGPKGDRGNDGKDGEPGPQGKPGKDGRDGYDGKDGLPGQNGRNGFDGKNGMPGKDGRDGLNGKDGAKGPKGDKGERGDIGPMGKPGDTGPMPKHQRKGLMIRFESSPGKWGEWIVIPTGGGGGGGRDDKLTDRQKELVEIGDLIRTQGNNSSKFIKTVNGVLQWDTLDGSDLDLSSPPAIGATTPSTGVFTTLTAQTEVLKGTGQNLITRSQQFSNATYSASTATRTDNQTTAPDGTSTGALIQATAVSYGGLVRQFSSTYLPSTTYTISVYAKAGTSNFVGLRASGGCVSAIDSYCHFNLATGVATAITPISGTIVSVAMTNAGSGWYRCSVTYTTGTTVSNSLSDFSIVTSTGGTNPVYAGTETIFAWGLQVELASSAGTYIPTTTTAVYGTPTLSFSGVSTIGLESNGSLFVQPAGTGALQAQATTSSATGGNARGANAVDWQTVRNAAVQVASGQYSVISGGAVNRATSSYAVVSGGNNNQSTGFGSVVAGGNSNVCTNSWAFLGAGQQNTVSGYPSAVITGVSNTAAGFHNFIGAGFTNSGTSGSAVTTQSGTMNGTTAVTLSGSNASIKVGQYITGTSIAAETYVAAISGTSLTLSKVASGSSTSTLSFFTPHGVVVGGGNNQATGSYSFIGGGGDAGTAANRNVASGAWSTVGGGLKNTASGIGSVVVGGGTYDGTSAGGGNTASGLGAFVGAGWSNNASNDGAVCIGVGNQANSAFSTTLGQYANSRGIIGNLAISPCSAPLSAIYTNQIAFLVLARQTTDATATVLTSNTSAASTTNQVILPNNSAYYFKGSVIANVTGGGNTKAWAIEGAIKRGANAASTALVGTPTVTSAYADVGAATWAITATADTTNGGLAITFTGQASTTIRVVAKLETTEVTF